MFGEYNLLGYRYYGIGGPGFIFEDKPFEGFDGQEIIDWKNDSHLFVGNGYTSFDLNQIPSEVSQYVQVNEWPRAAGISSKYPLDIETSINHKALIYQQY